MALIFQSLSKRWLGHTANGKSTSILFVTRPTNHPFVIGSIRPQLNEFSTASETITFQLEAQFSDITSLNVWYTRFGWDGMTQTNSTFFEQQVPITVENGQFSLTINPDELYSITTLTTVTKASISTPPAPSPFPTPYADNFDSYNISSEARYFADQAGQLVMFVW
jgi:galactosylceramidase